MSLGKNCRIEIGAHVIFAEGAAVFIGPGASFTLGDHIFIGRNSVIAANEAIRIGSGTQIAHQVTLIDTDHKHDDPYRPLREQGQITAPIDIGSEVWVGALAIILRGRKIGDHAVIAGGAVVTKDVESRTLVGGNPARVLS